MRDKLWRPRSIKEMLAEPRLIAGAAGTLTYPPRSEDFTGAVAEVINVLNTPRLVERRIRDIATQRYISDQLFTQGGGTSGGAVQFQQSESIFAEGEPEIIEPGGKFPMSNAAQGPIQTALVAKRGHDGMVTLESVLRRAQNPLEREARKLANNVVRDTDAGAMRVLADAPIQSMAGSDFTVATAAQKLRMIAEAKAMITKKNEGYEPNTLVMDDDRAVDFVSDPDIAKAINFEENVAYVGYLGTILGLRIMITPNLVPAFAAGTTLVMDRDQVGERDDEVPFQAKSWWVEADEHGDEYWRLRAKRHTLHLVSEPDAVVEILGT